MVAYLIRRILLAVPTLIGAATVSFLLLRVLPGNPADLIAGPYASPQLIANIHRQLGLDPLKDTIRRGAQLPLGQLRDALVATARAHGAQTDDQTVLVVRFS